MKSFCHQLPKVELHAHLNGSLSKSTLKELGCMEDSVIQYYGSETDLKKVFDLFTIAHNLTNNPATLYTATKRVIEEFSEDNVIYLELRTTPRSTEDMSEDDYVETVVRAIETHGTKGIIVKLILSLDRRKTYEQQVATLSKIIKFQTKYPDIVKGVDLSGDPSKGTFMKDLFEVARKNGLSTAIHCGEIRNEEEITEMLNFKPDRLGHCTYLHPKYLGKKSEIWEIYKDAKIPVECCLTSNVRCLTVNSYEEHHLQEWLAESLPFCLGTDDKGVFGTSLSQEFLIASKTFNLNQLDLWTICKNSIDYSFASLEEKQLLHFKLNQWKTENMNHIIPTS